MARVELTVSPHQLRAKDGQLGEWLRENALSCVDLQLPCFQRGTWWNAAVSVIPPWEISGTVCPNSQALRCGISPQVVETWSRHPWIFDPWVSPQLSWLRACFVGEVCQRFELSLQGSAG